MDGESCPGVKDRCPIAEAHSPFRITKSGEYATNMMLVAYSRLRSWPNLAAKYLFKNSLAFVWPRSALD